MLSENENIRMDDATFKKAMNSYAKDVAIAFGKWLQQNVYADENGIIRINPDAAKQIGGSIKTEQLFDLYKKDNP